MTTCAHTESKRVCMHPDGVHIWWCPECGALKGGNAGGWQISALHNRLAYTALKGQFCPYCHGEGRMMLVGNDGEGVMAAYCPRCLPSGMQRAQI